MRGAESESVSAHARYSGYRAPAQYIKHNKNMTNSQKGTTIGNGVTSVEKYVEQVKKELSDQLTSGVTVTFSDGTSNVKLGDGTWVTYSAQVSTNGVNMTQYYFARKVGKYFLQITATDVSGIGQAAFEKMFTVPSAETGTAS